MHEDEHHCNVRELTARPVVAAPNQNRAITCAEEAGEFASRSCETDYEHLSLSAARCCGGGASYCPAPQLCADPAAFDPAAPYDFLCYSMLSPAFDDPMCSAAGCHPSHHEGQGYCTCQVTDSAACLAKLPGTLSRACVRVVRGRWMHEDEHHRNGGELTDDTPGGGSSCREPCAYM